MRAIIIGGGWAGLSAGFHLARNGVEVELLEAARQLGGRARAIKFGKNRVDNGQHIMLGAYKAYLGMLSSLNISEASVLKRLPLNLVALDGKRRFQLKAGNLPAPLHLLSGLLAAHGLGLKDKYHALKGILGMWRMGFRLERDIPLDQFLSQAGQTRNLIRSLWYPLCISVMNAPLHESSSQLFLNVMRDAFFARKNDSDLLLPVADLTMCLPEPAANYIEQNGGTIHLGTRVEHLQINDNMIGDVVTREKPFSGDHVIVATHPEAAYDLLKGQPALSSVNRALEQLRPRPITTLYLRYPEHVTLPLDFIGLLQGHAQWIFDRGRLTNNPGVLAAVISGPGPHMDMSAQELTEKMVQEIHSSFPDWPSPLETKLVREKRATLAAVPGVEEIRPVASTGVEGLWIAGDYTRTGYPSTLEGAVRSGLDCANKILGEN